MLKQMLHLSNLGIWSDEERWEREKTMGKMKMGKRIVAERNKSVSQSPVVHTYQACSQQQTHNICQSSHINQHTNTPFNSRNVVKCCYKVFLTKSQKFMKFPFLFPVIYSSRQGMRVRLIMLLKKYTQPLPFYSLFTFTTKWQSSYYLLSICLEAR